MIFWAGILVGGFFIWLAVRIGFFETLALMFNIVISIYTAIFLTPLLIDFIPAAGETTYCHALALVVIATGTFGILHGITYIFLTGQFKVTFPKIFDILFSGALGFLAGFFVLSFVALAITVTPISQNKFLSKIGFSRYSQKANLSYICWWCDKVNSIVSSPDNKITSEQAVNQLLDKANSKEPEKTDERAEPNEPNSLNISTNEENRSPSP